MSETKQELPGELALQLAIQRGEWPHTPDASIWARKFMKAVVADPGIATDMGTMIGWFGNAIMAGYDTAMNRKKIKVEG